MILKIVLSDFSNKCQKNLKKQTIFYLTMMLKKVETERATKEIGVIGNDHDYP